MLAAKRTLASTLQRMGCEVVICGTNNNVRCVDPGENSIQYPSLCLPRRLPASSSHQPPATSARLVWVAVSRKADMLRSMGNLHLSPLVLGIVWPLATRRLLPYYNWEPDLYFSVILGCVRLFFCWRQSSCLTPSVCMCIVRCHKHIQPEGDMVIRRTFV